MEWASLIFACLAVGCLASAQEDGVDERALSPLMKMAMELRSKKAASGESSLLMQMAKDIRAKQAVATTAYAVTSAPTSSAPVTVTQAPVTAAPTTKAPATAAPTTHAPAPATTAAYTAAPGPAHEPAQKPNIIVFVADDLGRADISYTQGNLQVPTPDIDRLAWDGIILNRHYSNPICTPHDGKICFPYWHANPSHR
ncbi:hypothetical protein BV898_08576 [Hypsibius exemplaris]|uniref:Uncharacterized protein n=1 Tax=Hypsibius exemplaris TaxID=2072580 RepID=A0A1W0WQA2_HYPEX|nr:hypothetical protein BV898_08576 [Hypsibius exemplaris]